MIQFRHTHFRYSFNTHISTFSLSDTIAYLKTKVEHLKKIVIESNISISPKNPQFHKTMHPKTISKKYFQNKIQNNSYDLSNSPSTGTSLAAIS